MGEIPRLLSRGALHCYAKEIEMAALAGALFGLVGSTIGGFNVGDTRGYERETRERLHVERHVDDAASIALRDTEIQRLRRTVREQTQSVTALTNDLAAANAAVASARAAFNAAMTAANNAETEALNILAAELTDPMAFALRMAHSSPKELKAQRIADKLITEALRRDHLSQHEIDQLLFWAVRLASIDKFVGHIKSLVDKGADVNFTDPESGHRPISLAIFHCLDKAVKALLACENIDLETPVNDETVHALAERQLNKIKKIVADGPADPGSDSLLMLEIYENAAMNIKKLLTNNN